MLLMIDNYDSFTYNLVHYFTELGVDVQTFRHDEIDLSTISRLQPNYIVLSPGPCTPNEAGITLEVLQNFAGQIPILGVCLGHQAIGQYFGAKVINAQHVMHGKTSQIYHDGEGIFHDLSPAFTATRYHSLVLDKLSLPDCLTVTAWSQNETGDIDEIMGIKHEDLAIEGVQFHPESILTDHGHDLLQNFLQRYAD